MYPLVEFEINSRFDPDFTVLNLFLVLVAILSQHFFLENLQLGGAKWPSDKVVNSKT